MSQAAVPEPTRTEAHALVAGSGLFWLCWGVAVFSLEQSPRAEHSPPVVGLVAFAIGFIAGGWMYLGGVLPVLARHEGRGAANVAFMPRGMRTSVRRSILMARMFAPSYLRRAARVIGWNDRLVLAVLGALLAADLVAAVWLFGTR